MKKTATIILNRNLPEPTDRLVQHLKKHDGLHTDVFVIEAGIGGRLDTTSIINSSGVVLTNVGYDHQDILGDTLEEILYEKIHISNNIKTLVCGEISDNHKK